MPKISFLVPVYNYQDYLETCIQSVLAQSDNAWELLLINDCSSDASGTICQSYADQDPRIRTIHLKENQGQYQIINRYSLELQGEYSCVLDADDYLAKDYVAQMHAFAHKDSKREIIMCLHQNRADNKATYKNNYAPGIPRHSTFKATEHSLFTDLLQLEYFIIDCGTLVKTQLRHKIYPHLPKVAMHAATDDMQALFLALHSKGIAVLRKPLYHHNQTSSGTWRNKSPEFQIKKVSSALISLEMTYHLVNSRLSVDLPMGLPMAENIRSKILETLENMALAERRSFYRKLLTLFDKMDLPFTIGPLSLLDLEARLRPNQQQSNEQRDNQATEKPLLGLLSARFRQLLRHLKYYLPYGLVRYIQHKRIWHHEKQITTVVGDTNNIVTIDATSAKDFLLWLTGKNMENQSTPHSSNTETQVKTQAETQASTEYHDYQKLAANERQTFSHRYLEACLQDCYKRGYKLSPSSLHHVLAPKTPSPKQLLHHALQQPNKWLAYLLPYAWVRTWARK